MGGPDPLEPSRWPRLGRRIATALVWAGLGYVVIVGLVSVIPQVFWSEPEARALAALPEACAPGVRDLKAELLARAGEQVATGGAAPGSEDLARWLRDWDERHHALGRRCTSGEGERAYDTLGRLRHRLGIWLERFEREQAPLARHIDRSLHTAFPDSHPTERQPPP